MSKVNRKTITISIVVALVLATILVWWLALGGRGSSPDENKAEDSTSVVDNSESNSTDDVDNSETDATDQDEETVEVDTVNMSSLVISQMDIEIFYSKGVPGFSYQISRTGAGTEYIEFTSDDLTGTKCTDDNGAFASIIKNPSSAEQTTTVLTKKVGLDTYGLALPGATCTSDAALLDKYQASFKAGFGNLRAAKTSE